MKEKDEILQKLYNSIDKDLLYYFVNEIAKIKMSELRNRFKVVTLGNHTKKGIIPTIKGIIPTVGDGPLLRNLTNIVTQSLR